MPERYASELIGMEVGTFPKSLDHWLVEGLNVACSKRDADEHAHDTLAD